jgi:hypothetical protein
MNAAERALLDEAVGTLRGLVAARPPDGTLHFGLFALARLLEEIAHVHGPDEAVTDPVSDAAVAIARHIVDHGVHLARPTTDPPPAQEES